MGEKPNCLSFSMDVTRKRSTTGRVSANEAATKRPNRNPKKKPTEEKTSHPSAQLEESTNERTLWIVRLRVTETTLPIFNHPLDPGASPNGGTQKAYRRSTLHLVVDRDSGQESKSAAGYARGTERRRWPTAGPSRHREGPHTQSGRRRGPLGARCLIQSQNRGPKRAARRPARTFPLLPRPLRIVAGVRDRLAVAGTGAGRSPRPGILGPG